MASRFDRAAATFGRYRALPPGVPEAIRRAIFHPGFHPSAHKTRAGDPGSHPSAHKTRAGDPGWSAAPARSSARVLDLGAGTGRIGKAFVDANDSYVGIDLSLAMLREFLSGSRAARLVQGGGQRLKSPPAS